MSRKRFLFYFILFYFIFFGGGEGGGGNETKEEEILPSIKQSTQQKREKNVGDERTQVLTNKKSSQEGRSLEEHEQIKYLNPPYS
jgi:hypothetical protein